MSRKDTTVEHSLSQVIPAHTALLVAVSGGIDSMVLLHGLTQISGVLKLRVGVVHVDHGLRDCSKNDAEFVRDESANLGYPFYLEKLNPPAEGENIEAWGRKERYRFFKEIRERHNFDWVLTAHNANDVAETLLMRLISGKELNSISFKEERRRLIRPLLNVPRTIIEKYSKEHKVNFREDPTNKDENFLRNKVRRTLLPILQAEFEQRTVEILSNQAEDIQSDLETLNELAQVVADKHPLADTDRLWRRALKESLASLPEGLQWRVMQRMFLAKLGFNLPREHSRALVRFINGEVVGVELPGGLRLRSHEGGIIFD